MPTRKKKTITRRPKTNTSGLTAAERAKVALNNRRLAALNSKTRTVDTRNKTLIFQGLVYDNLGVSGILLVSTERIRQELFELFKKSGWIINDFILTYVGGSGYYTFSISVSYAYTYTQLDIANGIKAVFLSHQTAGYNTFNYVQIGVAKIQEIESPVLTKTKTASGKGSGVGGFVNDVSKDGLVPTLGNATGEVLFGEPIDILGIKIPKYLAYAGAGLAIYTYINKR